MANMNGNTFGDYEGDQGDEQEDFTPKARYAGPDVVCSNCDMFDGKSQCSSPTVIQETGGTVDPGGRCEEFEEKDEANEPPVPAAAPMKKSTGKAPFFGSYQ